MQMSDILSEIHVDYTALIARFSGNEALLKRFLLKFPEDENFRLLLAAVENNDYDAAERSAHTLKGLGANLGFDSLSAACGEMAAAVRAGRISGIALLFNTVRAEYEAVLKCLQKMS